MIFAFSFIEILPDLWNHAFCIGYSDILNQLATVIYSLCFKKQTLELLLYLSFKVELPADL